MKLLMAIITSIIFAFALLSCAFYLATKNSIFFILSVTFFTIFYHFAMRFIVGFIVNTIMHNKADYNKRWFRTSRKELDIYKKLKVKKWKNRVPSLDSSRFDITKHTWHSVVQAMCQAEIVHEVNMILSFVPLLFTIFAGHFLFFLITSFIASLFDYVFVIVQRYNRNRIIHSVTFENDK